MLGVSGVLTCHSRDTSQGTLAFDWGSPKFPHFRARATQLLSNDYLGSQQNCKQPSEKSSVSNHKINGCTSGYKIPTPPSSKPIGSPSTKKCHHPIQSLHPAQTLDLWMKSSPLDPDMVIYEWMNEWMNNQVFSVLPSYEGINPHML